MGMLSLLTFSNLGEVTVPNSRTNNHWKVQKWLPTYRSRNVNKQKDRQKKLATLLAPHELGDEKLPLHNPSEAENEIMMPLEEQEIDRYLAATSLAITTAIGGLLFFPPLLVVSTLSTIYCLIPILFWMLLKIFTILYKINQKVDGIYNIVTKHIQYRNKSYFISFLAFFVFCFI